MKVFHAIGSRTHALGLVREDYDKPLPLVETCFCMS